MANLKNLKCSIEGCGKKHYARGVCHAHYRLMAKSVRKGSRTWGEFERAKMSRAINGEYNSIYW